MHGQRRRPDEHAATNTEGTGYRGFVCHQRSAFGRAVVSALDFLTPPQPERAIFGPGGPLRLRQIEQRTVTHQKAPFSDRAARTDNPWPWRDNSPQRDRSSRRNDTRQTPHGHGRYDTPRTVRSLPPLGPSGPDDELPSRRAFCSQTTAPLAA